MKKPFRTTLVAAVCAVAVAALLLPSHNTRAADPGYALEWFTHDAGGAMHAAPTDGYVLNGTVGQVDAAAPGAVSNGYTLSGGFWANTDARAGVYLPVVTR